MLAISTKAQPRTNKSEKNSIADVNGVIRVSADATLRLASLGLSLLPVVITGTLALFLLSFALESLSLGGSFHILLEEVGVNGCDVGGVDVDERGGAFGFILVDAANVGGATECVSLVIACVSSSSGQ